jgi:hypothetical protein
MFKKVVAGMGWGHGGQNPLLLQLLLKKFLIQGWGFYSCSPVAMYMIWWYDIYFIFPDGKCSLFSMVQNYNISTRPFLTGRGKMSLLHHNFSRLYWFRYGLKCFETFWSFCVWQNRYWWRTSGHFKLQSFVEKNKLKWSSSSSSRRPVPSEKNWFAIPDRPKVQLVDTVWQTWPRVNF